MIGLAVWLGQAAATHAADPHRVGAGLPRAACDECHAKTPVLPGGLLTSKNYPSVASELKQDGVAMCKHCHDTAQGHRVGVDIDFPVPADLPLNGGNAITCLTCHYVHGSLDSDRPQASVSFLDRLLNAERLRKSFLLRRNNTGGELCLTCHNVNQGSNHE